MTACGGIFNFQNPIFKQLRAQKFILPALKNFTLHAKIAGMKIAAEVVY